MCGTTTGHVYTKDEVLQNIASATTAAQLVETMPAVDKVRDKEVYDAFLEKLPTIVGETDSEGLKLLKEYLVDGNFRGTTIQYDDKLRKVIVLQIIATSTTAAQLLETKSNVDDLENDEVTAAYKNKLASL